MVGRSDGHVVVVEPEVDLVAWFDAELVSQFLGDHDLPFGSDAVSHTCQYNCGAPTAVTAAPAWQTLAVFVGGFDLDAFTGVFGNDDDTAVLQALDRLVRSSLVVAEHADGRVRYRLLETIRQFGIDELATADVLDSSPTVTPDGSRAWWWARLAATVNQA